MKISNLGNARLRKSATSKQYNNDGEKKALNTIRYFLQAREKKQLNYY